MLSRSIRRAGEERNKVARESLATHKSYVCGYSTVVQHNNRHYSEVVALGLELQQPYSNTVEFSISTLAVCDVAGIS